MSFTALAAENYQYAKVGCRPPGGIVRYWALEAGYASSRLFADATARRSVAYLSNFLLDLFSNPQSRHSGVRRNPEKQSASRSSGFRRAPE